MDFQSFEALALEMWEGIPARYREGVEALILSPEARFDPEFPDVPLMGFCEGSPITSQVPEAPLQTMISVYHGSFVEVASQEEAFDWEGELWETLTHELLHHLEWRAGYDALGLEDDLQRENLARRAGGEFARWFHRQGAALEPGVWSLDGDLFVEVPVARKAWRGLAGQAVEASAQGVRFCAAAPSVEALREEILYLVAEPASEEALPWDEVVLVVWRKPWWSFWG
jgi:hypothetical protein